MEGIDPDYRRYLQGAIYVLANDLVSTVIDSYGRGNAKRKEATKEKLKTFVQELVDDMTKEAQQYRQEFFVDPITNMAQMLPKPAFLTRQKRSHADIPNSSLKSKCYKNSVHVRKETVCFSPFRFVTVRAPQVSDETHRIAQ